MKLETIMKMEDSERKFLLLEKNLLKIQWHGGIWWEAFEECKRLRHIYRGKKVASFLRVKDCPLFPRRVCYNEAAAVLLYLVQ